MSDRKSLSFGDNDSSDENEGLDLSSLVVDREAVTITPSIKKKLDIAGAKVGFVSRESKPARRRRRSPYTVNLGTRCREGMKPLIQEIGERMNVGDAPVIEKAILALIEKEGFNDLMPEYENILSAKLEN